MMRWLFPFFVLSAAMAVAQQGSADSGKPDQSNRPASSQASSPSTQFPSKPGAPNLAPPRSDRVDAGALGDRDGESSSKNTQIDLSPPENDDRAHPHSADALADVAADTSGASVSEFHIWDPHKAAKSVEVGDYYFKRKNYRAAEDRYREALHFKDNDAIATFRLAVCLEKLNRPEDARAEYESYIGILPHGPFAEEAQKSIERLKDPAAKAAK